VFSRTSDLARPGLTRPAFNIHYAAYLDFKHNAATSITLPRALTQKTPACSVKYPLDGSAAILFGDVDAKLSRLA
jgi:hypothetical protein